MSYCILFFSSHNSVCVCVCVCVWECASVQCMYRVHNGLPLHKKSYGTQCTCTCMYRRPFLYIPWTLHAVICTCTDQCAVKGGSIENHSYENSTCTESCQRNTVSFTQCVYMHKSVGVGFECSSDFKLQGITYEVTATIEGQDARLHALDGILLT